MLHRYCLSNMFCPNDSRMLVLKTIQMYIFSDGDDVLKAVLTVKATKPDTNPSCEDSPEIVNPVQSPACATETGTTVARIHASTSE